MEGYGAGILPDRGNVHALYMYSRLTTIQIPLIWEEWGPAAEKEYQKKLHQWERAREQQLADADDADVRQRSALAKPQRRMHPEDADNFLALAAALKILLARSIECDELQQARELLQSYLHKYREVSRQ